MVVKNGGGRHIGDLGLEMYGHGLYYTFIATSMLVVPQIFTKASIGVTILRIAVQRPYRIATIANIIFMLIVSTGTLIVRVPIHERHRILLMQDSVLQRCM